MAKIVILGGGFGGLTTALALEKKFRRNPEVLISVIDRQVYHQFNPNLYEVAASDEEFTNLRDLRLNSALPFREILRNKNLRFIQSEITAVDLPRRRVKAGLREIDYDYLILALGSRTDFLNVPGARDFALPFKTLKDALFLRNQLAFAVESKRQEVIKGPVRFVVAGGGYTGCELAAELTNLASVLAWKFQYPREKIEIEIVEAANRLLPGLNPAVSRQIADRLRSLGVYVRLLSPAVAVERHLIRFLHGETAAFDCLIWTAGVEANFVAFDRPMAVDKKGRLVTGPYLELPGAYGNVFVIGDQSCILDESGAPAPASAQDAIHQAEYLASALPLLMVNKRPKGFTCKKHGLIIALGGKWAIFQSGRYFYAGFWPYVLRKLANFRYYASILGWWKALRLIVSDWRVYGRND